MLLRLSLAAPYALAVAIESAVNKISLVGFDGYKNNEKRQKEMEKVFKQYLNIESGVPIVSLTPTNYDIDEKILS